jgi:hypothetical protein
MHGPENGGMVVQPIEILNESAFQASAKSRRSDSGKQAEERSHPGLLR